MEPQQPQTTPAPVSPTPVMDVVPPPATEPVAVAPPEEVQSKATETATDLNPTPAETAKQPALPKPTPAKPQNKGVTAAIIATVVIVLGLAVLAVVAYLKQK